MFSVFNFFEFENLNYGIGYRNCVNVLLEHKIEYHLPFLKGTAACLYVCYMLLADCSVYVYMH